MRVTTTVRRVGNSFAIFIPADKAREAQLREGDVVEAEVEPQAKELLGMFKHLGLGPWTAQDKKWGWPDAE